MEWMQFSRKNLSFPRLQEYPHKCFSAEVEYLKALLRYGEGHILGPVTSDHWYLYVAELSDEYTHADTDFKFDMMMYDLSPECCKRFFSADGRTSADVRKELRLQEHLPKACIQDVLFKPCGYSMNALQVGGQISGRLECKRNCFLTIECKCTGRLLLYYARHTGSGVQLCQVGCI